MARGDSTRWLYRGRRPNWLARMVNRLTGAIFARGVAVNYLATLEVTGRKSGRTLSLPVVIAIVEGQRYLVSMLGENVSWARTFAQLAERQFCGAAVVSRSNSKRCPSASARPS